jgi:hypothetical protein
MRLPFLTMIMIISLAVLIPSRLNKNASKDNGCPGGPTYTSSTEICW